MTSLNLIVGETGIRTPEPVTQLLPFQGSAIDHSAISPDDAFYIIKYKSPIRGHKNINKYCYLDLLIKYSKVFK